MAGLLISLTFALFYLNQQRRQITEGGEEDEDDEGAGGMEVYFAPQDPESRTCLSMYICMRTAPSPPSYPPSTSSSTPHP